MKGQLCHPTPASSAPISIQRVALHHLPPTPSPATPTPHLSATSAAVPATLSTFTIPCQLLKPSHQWERPKPQQCQIPPHPALVPLPGSSSYLTCCFSQGQTLSFKTLSCAFPSRPTPSPGQLQQTLQIPWSHTGLVMPSWTLCSLIAPGTGPPASPDPCKEPPSTSRVPGNHQWGRECAIRVQQTNHQNTARFQTRRMLAR